MDILQHRMMSLTKFKTTIMKRIKSKLKKAQSQFKLLGPRSLMIWKGMKIIIWIRVISYVSEVIK